MILKKKWRGLLVATALVLSQMSLATSAQAQANAISIDFKAAEPTSYNHLTGGGGWNDGKMNQNIVSQLEGSSFACDDTVSYLTRVVVPTTSDLVSYGKMTIDMDYSISMDTTGQSGAALGEPVTAQLNIPDTANSYNDSSTVTIVKQSTSGSMFTKGSEIYKTVRLTGAEAGETFVIRMDVKIRCQAGKIPTGNLQVKLLSSSLVFKNTNTAIDPPEVFGTGNQTISLQKIENVGIPSLSIVKTVTTATGTCPGAKYLEIQPKQAVKYCYAVTNNVATGAKMGAPLYNISNVFDDHGQYPDYQVTLTSGLTDIDKDGQVDDLAIGATAYGEIVKSFDGAQDTYVTNIATVNADGSPNGGTKYNASDTAQIYIDPVHPKIEIKKDPKTQTVLEGEKANFTITVTNTGDIDLTGVVVSDPLSSNCNKTIGGMTPGAQTSYTCTSDAITGDLTNVASVEGHYNSTTVTSQDSAKVSIDYKPNITVVKTANPTAVDETGGDVVFTFAVTNNAPEDFQLTSLNDDIFGNLDGQGDCKLEQKIKAGDTYTCTVTKTLASDLLVTHKDTVTAQGHDPQGNPGSGSDDAAVTFNDLKPSMDVTKTVDPKVLPESGGDATFTFVVTNKSKEALSLTSLSDDKFGDLNGKGSCVTPQTIVGLGTYTCTYTTHLGDWTINPFDNTVTAKGQDNDGNKAEATASAEVTFTDLIPTISLEKTVNPTTIHATGDYVDYTFKITNTGPEAVIVTLLTDNTITLSTECNNLVGQVIPISGFLQCVSHVAVTIPEGNPKTITNTASAEAKDNENNKATASDDAVLTIDYLPNIEVTKSADPTMVDETGGTVTFTFSVKNKAPENFILTSLSDDKFGDLNTQGTCSVPQTIAAGATYSCTLTKTLASDLLVAHTNVLTAEGHDPEDNPGKGSDDATVTFKDVLPSMEVTKSADPKVLLESGGDATFTFVVKNKSAETLKLTSLVDDKFGDLSGKGSCVTPQFITGMGTYTCTYSTHLGDWTTNPFNNTVVAKGEDNDGNKTEANASAQVTFTDLIPKISVTKTVNPTVIRLSGDYVDYTIRITNTGPEAVILNSLVDNKITLPATCTNLVTQTIPIAGYLECVAHVFVQFDANTTFINTVTAIANDNENNNATASGSATLKNFWFGRTPGYWKNHPTAWISGYTPGQYVQSVFNVPSSLLSSLILDLDGNKNKDTLIDALAYKGGTDLKGAAQILLRASVAALLNKAYYGADYPAEVSTTALIDHVNTVLASLSRDQYLALATTYDKWNNGVESALP